MISVPRAALLPFPAVSDCECSAADGGQMRASLQCIFCFLLWHEPSKSKAQSACIVTGVIYNR